ncbi:Membrane protein involved in the export of O-antigen and teichoic acid [Streptomyces sp. OV198]|nr:Membrane protein involved in the export of O-antigen and teichoic acid [Streptomyces sp. OV198]
MSRPLLAGGTRASGSINIQAIYLALGIGLAQVIAAMMYAIAARNGGPAAFGSVVAWISVGMACAGLLDFGSNAYWIRELASRRLPASHVGIRVLWKLGTAFLLAVTWTMVARMATGAWQSGIGSAIAVSVLVSQTMAVGLRAAERADLAAATILIDRLSALSIMTVLILFGTSSSSALWIGLVGGALIAGGAAWRLTPPDFRFRIAGARARNPWQGTAAYGVSTVSAGAQALDVALLSSVGGPIAAGLYGAVSRWTQSLGLLVSAFSQVAAPVVASASSWDEAWARLRRGLWLPAVAIAGCVGVAAGAPWFVTVILGDDYAESADVLQVLALGTVPAIANQPLAVFLQSRGHQRPVSFLLVVGVSLQLATVLVLGPGSGALAAAAALALGQAVLLVGLLSLTRRYSPGRS